MPARGRYQGACDGSARLGAGVSAVEIDKAVVFAEREGYRALELDVYRSGEPVAGLSPLVHYVHGGGWRVSHRSRAPRETRPWARGFFERITDAGFVVAASDYRFSSEARFPAQLDDVVEASRWLRLHAPELGTDPRRTYVWGASAGGNLAALLALVAEPGAIAGAVCWYPVTDVLGMDTTSPDTYEAHLLGGPVGERRGPGQAGQPSGPCACRRAPFLLQHGEVDTWVPCDQSVRLARALESAGVPVELDLVPGADHFFEGADDVEAIFDRALQFLLALDRRQVRESGFIENGLSESG